MYYPKRSSNALYQRLTQQLVDLGVPFTDDFQGALKETHHVIDALFGFSFSPPIREPFPAVIAAMRDAGVPVTSVDAPSGWGVETGPPEEGPAKGFMPDALVSLTAPKPLVRYYRGRHFVGGRFVAPGIAEKYGVDIPEYQGVDQIVEVGEVAEGEKL